MSTFREAYLDWTLAGTVIVLLMVILTQNLHTKLALEKELGAMQQELRIQLLQEKIAQFCTPKLQQRVHVEWIRGELIMKRYTKRLHQMDELSRDPIATLREVQQTLWQWTPSSP